MQDPETYLEARKIELHSFFDPARHAVLDVEHRARVNYELFYFADVAERERFQKAPLAYCGMVTDPVTYVRFQPNADSPRVDYHGQPFFFASNVSRKVFSAMPDSFLVPKYEMPVMDDSAPDMKDE